MKLKPYEGKTLIRLAEFINSFIGDIMKMPFFLILCVFLTACSETNDVESTFDNKSAETAVTTTVTTTVRSEAVAEHTEPEPEYKTISADVTDYKDGKLFFTYEGTEYETEMPQSKFYEDGSFVRPKRDWPTLSEKIIHNKFGEKIKAYINISEDMTSIQKCDVMTLNVKEYSGDYPYYTDVSNGFKTDPDRLYSFKRTEGSKCIVSNKYNSFEFDLNDLIIQDRPRFEDEYDLVTFSGYRFKSGNIILKSLLPACIEKDGSVTGRSEYLKEIVMKSVGYCGTVLKNENGTAEVLLNDGKTVLVVPSYFNDGEVSTGMHIMVDTQQTEEKFYGTGQRAELGQAVIYTVKEHYISFSYDHEPTDLAYIILGTEDSLSMSDYTYVTTEEFENSHKEG